MRFHCRFLPVLCLLGTFAHAAEPWGHAAEAGDDRFTNPKKPLYAGPDGWWNMGEVRAEVNNAAKTPYAFKGPFQLVHNEFTAVGGPSNLQVILFDFADKGVPESGDYKVSAKGSLKEKRVHISFADTSGKKIREWASVDGAGVLTISRVHGFLYFTCRNLNLQAGTVYNRGDDAKPMTFGFEGAMTPAEVKSYEME